MQLRRCGPEQDKDRLRSGGPVGCGARPGECPGTLPAPLQACCAGETFPPYRVFWKCLPWSRFLRTTSDRPPGWTEALSLTFILKRICRRAQLLLWNFGECTLMEP